MLIPPFFIDSVVALGAAIAEGEKFKWATTGTGFFYGAVQNPEIQPNTYQVFLVTCRHVVQQHINKGIDIRVRLDSKDPTKPVQDFELPRTAGGAGEWFFHPSESIDIAVIPVSWDFLRQNKIEPGFFSDNVHAANREILKERQVAAGDGVFVLGFPMGLTGEQRNYVIVRQGCIARISEMLDGAKPDYLIDASVYPGNSGGPVILRN
jgi:hypothetical protein